ncbi:MAG: terminase small subunit [Cyclobacteriaceae bacterium]
MTAKENQFCIEFIVDNNGTQAAARAGYSKKTARQIATKLLSKVYIQDEIARLKEEINSKKIADITEVLEGLTKIVRFDKKEIYDENGGLLSIHKMPDDHRFAIQQLESEEIKDRYGNIEGYSKKVKGYSKLDAMEKLLKYHGGYEKDNQQKTPDVLYILPDNGRSAVNSDGEKD